MTLTLIENASLKARKLKKNGIIFVFGAGASKAENAPTTNELLKYALTELKNEGRIFDLKEFLREFFYVKTKDLELWPLPTFEEVLSMVDISLSRQDELSKEIDHERLLTIRDSLIYSIARILEHSLERGGNVHKRFVNNLFDNLETQGMLSTSFINLNYDILLDKALFSLYPSKDIDVDYAIDFRNTVDRKKLNNKERREFILDPNEWYRPRRGKSIPLLKPHGSLNWLYCPSCNTVRITKGEKGVMWTWQAQVLCEDDHCRQKAMIVPPTFEKAYDNPHFTRILLKADEALRHAQKVFFVGYSLPDADIGLKYLFKRALYSRFPASRPEISVVLDDRPTNAEVKTRYRRFFGSKVKVHTKGFAHLADNIKDYLE